MSTVAGRGVGVVAVEDASSLFGCGAVGVAMGETLEQEVMGVEITALAGLLSLREQFVGVESARLAPVRIARGQGQRERRGGKKW